MHWRRRGRRETEGRLGQHAAEQACRCRTSGQASPADRRGASAIPGGQGTSLGAAWSQHTDLEAEGESLGMGPPGALAGRVPLPTQALRSMTTLHAALASTQRKPWLAGLPRPGVRRRCPLGAPGNGDPGAHDGNSLDTSSALLPAHFPVPRGASWSPLPYQLLMLVTLFQGLLWEEPRGYEDRRRMSSRPGHSLSP